MVASKTHLPVLGVPVQSKTLSGMDSLLSIVQMPAGIPTATFAIGEASAINAALFAVALLGPGPARSLLAVLWLGAVSGAVVRLVWVRAPKWFFVPMYLALGWASAMFLPGFLRSYAKSYL